ncbi:MAG: hypothetical protein R3267_06215 [Paenisporosarcina sp.]|nr:hypothetical protein [Paenisporosarcina sp.]
MLTDLLWFLGAKQQHDMQKEQGAAGLFGLLLVIFMVWKWESIFYPLFNNLGLVGMAERIGLVHELPVMTVINVIALIFVVSVFIALGAFGFVVIGGIFLMIGSSEKGQTFLAYATIILFFPIILLFLIFHKRNGYATPEKAYAKNKELKPLITKYKNEQQGFKHFYYYLEQSKRKDANVEFPLFMGVDKIKPLLQRAVASIKDNREWLVAWNEKEDQWYIVFPNPLPEFASPAFKSDQNRTNKPLYDYKSLCIQKPESYSSPDAWNYYCGYTVPAIRINFKWNGLEFVPSLAQASNDTFVETFKVTSLTHAFRINTPDMATLYNEVAELYVVQKAIKEAHLAIYLIPLAFPSEPGFNNTKEFLEELNTIPNTDVFAPIYAAEVHERIVHYAECGRQWAIDLIKSPV